ncbi:MAG: TetR/AcrR family transcriptional regulator [Myxococcota bacterium]
MRAAKTEAIARASQVSTATLFNYFPSKAALAGAWVRGELDRAIQTAAQELSDRGLRPILRAACRGLAAQSRDAPALRLDAWQAAGRARNAGGEGPGFERVGREGGGLLVEAVRREQQGERVRSDVSPGVLAEMLLDALESGLIAGLRADQTEDAVARGLQARVDLILDGARKRNERVESPRRAEGP